jgi:hypothetical protein
VTVITNGSGYNLLSPTVIMANGTVELSYAGLPYCSYALDWATNLTAPVDWLPIITNTANSNGLVTFTNDPGASTPNFFRARQP